MCADGLSKQIAKLRHIVRFAERVFWRRDIQIPILADLWFFSSGGEVDVKAMTRQEFVHICEERFLRREIAKGKEFGKSLPIEARPEALELKERLNF